MSRMLWLPDVLTDAYRGTNVTVSVEPGWDTRGNGNFDPIGLVAHHTAETGNFDNICNYCFRTAKYAPLCHIVSRHDGLEVRVGAAGRTNHAGKGNAPWAGTDGNGHLVGWEAQGHPAIPWEPKHLDTQARGHAAILNKLGQPASHLLEHYEWAGPRKTDRHSIDPDRWRGIVASLMTRRKEFPVDAVLLVHPSTGTPDALAALAGIFDRPDQRVGLVCNADAAKAALREGKRVWAIGGAAAAMVDGDRDLVGAARLDTLAKVQAQAAKGW